MQYWIISIEIIVGILTTFLPFAAFVFLQQYVGRTISIIVVTIITIYALKANLPNWTSYIDIFQRPPSTTSLPSPELPVPPSQDPHPAAPTPPAPIPIPSPQPIHSPEPRPTPPNFAPDHLYNGDYSYYNNPMRSIAETRRVESQNYPGIGWAFFGWYHPSGWRTIYWLGGQGLNGRPLAGDNITAIKSINIRSGPIYQDIDTWINEPITGNARPGDKYHIFFVLEVAPGYFWVKIGK